MFWPRECCRVGVRVLQHSQYVFVIGRYELLLHHPQTLSSIVQFFSTELKAWRGRVREAYELGLAVSLVCTSRSLHSCCSATTLLQSR